MISAVVAERKKNLKHSWRLSRSLEEKVVASRAGNLWRPERDSRGQYTATSLLCKLHALDRLAGGGPSNLQWYYNGPAWDLG